MTEKSWVQTLHWGDHFSCTIHLDQSMEAKIKWKLTICCISCNPAKGRVDFEDGWLIKSSFIRVKWKLVSWPGPKSHQKKNLFSLSLKWTLLIFVELSDNLFCVDLFSIEHLSAPLPQIPRREREKIKLG
jgi:hypothetical protein